MSNIGAGTCIFPSWSRVGGAAAPSTLSNGLIHYWNLNETAGARANAITPAWTLAGGDYGAGKRGNAAYIDLDNSLTRNSLAGSQLGSGSFTIALWVKFTTVGTTELFEVLYAPALPRELRVEGGAYNFSLWDSSFNHAQADGPAVTTGVWHSVVAWFDTVTMKTYLSIDNAAPVVSAVALVDLADAGTCSLTVNTPDTTVALIDEIAVWNRALISDERTELYNGGAGKFYPFS